MNQSIIIIVIFKQLKTIRIHYNTIIHCAVIFGPTFELHHEYKVYSLCKNKDADQLCSNCTADQYLCFCYMASIITLLLKYKISIFLPFFPECTGWFVSDLIGKPEDRFSYRMTTFGLKKKKSKGQ